MSSIPSLEVRRFENHEINTCLNEIEDKSKIGIKSAVGIGYGKLEEQRGKCLSRVVAVSSVVFSGWCLFSASLSGFGTVKAYDEFGDDGGFSDGGGSIVGHTAEWWPRVIGSTVTSISWIYFLNNKGKFHNLARLCEEKIASIPSSMQGVDLDVETAQKEMRRAIIDYHKEKSREYRGKLPFFGDDEYIIQPSQEVDLEASDELEDIQVD